MATHEALREDVMTLVRHAAAEFRRARPNYFDDRLAYETHGAPKLDEAATAARYELHSILRIMRALGPTYFMLSEIREGEVPLPPEVGDGYDGARSAYEHGDTVLGKVDDDLRARVTADIHADARIAPIYKQLIEIALTVAFTAYARDYGGVVDHDTPWGVLNDLPIVFPRLELDGASATLELTMPLREIASEHAYVAKWESRRREGLERVVRVYPMLFAEGRLFAYARSKGVQRLVVAGDMRRGHIRIGHGDREVRLDDEAEARMVEQFWEPSAELWGIFPNDDDDRVWGATLRAQLDFVRAASGSHPQFAARDSLPYPRTLRAARSTAGRRPVRYDE
jgi:hypothetical protein